MDQDGLTGIRTEHVFRIGCHLSAAKGYAAMGRQALKVGANTFQFFSRNPRGGAVRALDPADIAAYNALAAEHNIACILAHAPYTVNPCSPKKELRDFAVRVIREDLERIALIPGAMYNLHPGSHVKQGRKQGIELIADTLNQAMESAPPVTVLLETMSGKGTEIGGTFEDIRDILERVREPDRFGVCMDTCHVHDAGFNISEDLPKVLERFDQVLGLQRLRAVHLNDSRNPLGARKDRHEKIGCGCIGSDAIGRIINNEVLRDLPFFLETPQDDLEGYAEEIRVLRKMRSVG